MPRGDNVPNKRHLHKRIVALRLQKYSLRLIARRLGCSHAYVCRVLAEIAPETRSIRAVYTLDAIGE